MACKKFELQTGLVAKWYVAPKQQALNMDICFQRQTWLPASAEAGWDTEGLGPDMTTGSRDQISLPRLAKLMARKAKSQGLLTPMFWSAYSQQPLHLASTAHRNWANSRPKSFS